MTTTAHEDQFTDAPESVRQPYDTASILRRNVADLEIALKQQTERADQAEEKLTTARDDMQSWIDSRNGWMERAEAAEAELHNEKRRLSFALNRDAFYDHTSGVFFCDPAFKIPRPQVRIETKDFRAVIDALLQSAEVTK